MLHANLLVVSEFSQNINKSQQTARKHNNYLFAFYEQDVLFSNRILVLNDS
jgi:hypothetical protein